MSLQQDTAPADVGAGNHVRKLSPAMGLLTLAGAVVVVGSFVVLAQVLAIGDTWVGFLFALYWAGLERGNLKKLPHCVVGAAVGLTVAYFMHALPQVMGTIAWAPCLAVVLVLVYCQIMGWFAIPINMATMLFLTIATIPMISAATQYPKLMISLAFGALYFLGVILIAKQVARRGERNRAVHREI